MPVQVSPKDDGSLTVTYTGFRQGLDTRSSPLALAQSNLPDAANVSLAGGYPERIDGSTLYETGMVMPDAQDPALHAIYRDPNAATNTHLFAGRDGHIYKFDSGSMVSLRRGLSTTADLWWSAVQLSDFLVFSNRTDGIYKYDGARVLPIGAKHVCDFESGEATWTGGGTADTTNVKQGLQGRKVTSTGTYAPMYLTPATALDLTSGLLPAASGGVDYAASDYFDFWVYFDTVTGLDTAATIVRLHTTPGSNYYTLAASGWGTLIDGWNHVHVLRSAFTQTGSATWASIALVEFGIDTTGATINATFDDCYTIYATPMPAVQIVTAWKSMLLGLRSDDEPAGLYYSIVGGPDIWDANAVYTIEEGDGTEMTGAFIGYGDQLIVTKSNSVHPVSVRLTGEAYPDYLFASPRRLTAEHGCDSHRSIVEAAGQWYMWWKGGLYRYKGVSTERVSYLFDAPTDAANGTTLASVNNARAFQVVGACLRKRNVAVWYYPTGSDTDNSAGIMLDYVEGGVVPIEGQALATAIVLRDDAGVESLLTSTYTGRILEQDSGTTFDGTAIPGRVTLPWASGGPTNPMISWLDAQLFYDTQTSGTLIVEYRVARHPREFATATWTQAASIDMSVADEYGHVPIGEIGRWLQLRVRTTASPFKFYWPVTVNGVLLGEN